MPDELPVPDDANVLFDLPVAATRWVDVARAVWAARIAGAAHGIDPRRLISTPKRLAPTTWASHVDARDAGTMFAGCDLDPVPLVVLLDPRRDVTSTDLRAPVIARYGATCVYCGRRLDPAARLGDPALLQLDHLCPWSLGGVTRATNLAPTCRECNCSKRDRVLGWYPGCREGRRRRTTAPRWEQAAISEFDVFV